MTDSQYKLMEHLEQAFDALVAAKNVAYSDKHPEAAAIANQLDALEDTISKTWQRFRTEANDPFGIRESQITLTNNPETLKYSINKSIKWTDEEGMEHEGVVSNVCFTGVEVVKNLRVTLVPFEMINNHTI